MREIIKRKISVLLFFVLLSVIGLGMTTGLFGCKEDRFGQELVFEHYQDGVYLVEGSKPDYKGEIVVPDFYKELAVVKIDLNAFNHDFDLKKITISKNVEVIESNAFLICEKLRQVIFNEGSKLLTIGSNAFSHTPLLTEISLPQSVQQLEKGVFSFSGIKGMVIPEGVEAIPENAFANCTNLKSVTLNDKLKAIDECAFKNATAIKSIIIPQSVMLVQDGAFEGWTQNQTINFEHESEPEEWKNSNWRQGCNANIVWGYRAEN